MISTTFPFCHPPGNNSTPNLSSREQTPTFRRKTYGSSTTSSLDGMQSSPTPSLRTINTNSIQIAIDWDPTALHLRYQSTRERVSSVISILITFLVSLAYRVYDPSAVQMLIEVLLPAFNHHKSIHQEVPVLIPAHFGSRYAAFVGCDEGLPFPYTPLPLLTLDVLPGPMLQHDSPHCVLLRNYYALFVESIISSSISFHVPNDAVGCFVDSHLAESLLSSSEAASSFYVGYSVIY